MGFASEDFGIQWTKDVVLCFSCDLHIKWSDQ